MKKEKTNIEKNEYYTRMLRGGAWYNPPYELRSAGTTVFPPAPRSNGFGFRLVLQTKEKK